MAAPATYQAKAAELCWAPQPAQAVAGVDQRAAEEISAGLQLAEEYFSAVAQLATLAVVVVQVLLLPLLG